MIENITDSMMWDGHVGHWWSYVKDMRYFRVQLYEGVFTVFEGVERGDMPVLTEPEEEIASIVLREVKDQLADL